MWVLSPAPCVDSAPWAVPGTAQHRQGGPAGLTWPSYELRSGPSCVSYEQRPWPQSHTQYGPRSARSLAPPGQGPVGRVVMAHSLTALIPENCAGWQETSWLFCAAPSPSCVGLFQCQGRKSVSPASVKGRQAGCLCQPGDPQPTPFPMKTQPISHACFCRLVPSKGLLFLGIHHSQ